MPRIACLATDPLTTRVLMAGQLAYLKQQGFEVTLIAAPGRTWKPPQPAKASTTSLCR